MNTENQLVCRFIPSSHYRLQQQQHQYEVCSNVLDTPDRLSVSPCVNNNNSPFLLSVLPFLPLCGVLSCNLPYSFTVSRWFQMSSLLINTFWLFALLSYRSYDFYILFSPSLISELLWLLLTSCYSLLLCIATLARPPEVRSLTFYYYLLNLLLRLRLDFGLLFVW